MQAQFTLDDANRLLPLLSSIAAEIEERRAERRRLTRLHEELDAAHSPEGVSQAIEDAEAQLFDNRSAIDAALRELEALGLSVLRTSPLTVHIPGRTQRGPIVFCWQPGEDRIGHGHLVGEEDDPRRPLKVRTVDGEAA